MTNIRYGYIHLGNIQLYNLIVPCLIHLTLFNIKCIYKQSKYGFRIRWQQCQFRKDQWMSQCVSVWETELGKIWPLFDNHHLKRVLVCLFKTSSLQTLHRVIYWWKYLGGPIVLRLSLNFQAWHPCCPFVRCNRRGWFRPPSVDCNYLWHFSSSSLSLSPSLPLLLVKISTLCVFSDAFGNCDANLHL